MKLESNKNNNQPVPNVSSTCAIGIVNNQLKRLYKCRETFTNSGKNAKQTQFFRGQKYCKLIIYKVLSKNARLLAGSKQTQFKPNTKPIKANISPKTKVRNENKPKHKFILDVCLLASLSGTQFLGELKNTLKIHQFSINYPIVYRICWNYL